MMVMVVVICQLSWLVIAFPEERRSNLEVENQRVEMKMKTKMMMMKQKIFVHRDVNKTAD